MTTNSIQDDLNEIIRIAATVKEKLPKQQTLAGSLVIEIGTHKEVVSMVLDHSVRARNDYDVLFADCKVYCDALGIPYTLKTQETWRRCCQYFQSKGMWEADVEGRKARMAKAADWSKHFK